MTNDNDMTLRSLGLSARLPRLPPGSRVTTSTAVICLLGPMLPAARLQVVQRQVHCRSPLACMRPLSLSRQPCAMVAAQAGRIGSSSSSGSSLARAGGLQLSSACARLPGMAAGPAPAAASRRRCRRVAALPPLAMINVDFASPSLVLGIALIGCGVALLQVRNLQREVSRDADIVVAAMISIVGSTLIFQGWRLDPLLLLCQALTTSVAFWYGLEAFKLRQQVVEDEEEAGLVPPPEGWSNQAPDTSSYTSAQRPGFLPPAADRPLPPWQQQQQQQQQQAPMQGMPGSRWGSLPPGDTSMPFDYYTGPADGASAPAFAGYDGQPQQQQQQMGAAGFAGQLPPLQQQAQQAGGPGMGFGGSGSYGAGSYGADPAGAGMYGQPQQQQYGAMPQQPGQPFADGSWYGPGGEPPAAGYGPAGVVPQLPAEGWAAQQQYGPAAAGAVGLLPDGSSSYPAAAGGAGRLPLPPAGQQQRQQRQPGAADAGSQRSYEQVDDWE